MERPVPAPGSGSRLFRTRWCVMGAGVLVVLAACAALFVLVLRDHGPVELALTNRGSAPAEVQLVLVVEGTTKAVRAEGRYLTIAAGETVNVILGSRSDAWLQLRIRAAEGSVHHHTLQQYLGTGRSMVIAVDFAEGEMIGARIREGSSGTFSDLAWTSE